MTAEAFQRLAIEDVSHALARHCQCDWGEMSKEGHRENNACVEVGLRLHSVYHDRKGVKFWIITEANRRFTTVLMPDDY